MSQQNEGISAPIYDENDDVNQNEQRRRLSRRQSSMLRKRNDSFVRSSRVEIVDVIDDLQEELGDIKRVFSSVEGNAGDDKEIGDASDISTIFNVDDNKIRRRSLWRRLARTWASRLHWVCLVAVSLAILVLICVLDKFDMRIAAFKWIKIPLWALFSIPTLMLFIFIVVEGLHFLLDKILSQLVKKSHWIVRIIVHEIMMRFKLVVTSLLCESLILNLLLSVTGGVRKEELWLAYSLCQAVVILSLALGVRSILMQLARDRISRHLFEQAVSDISFAKDMLVLLCVMSDVDERDAIRQKWAENKRRQDYDMQLQRTATSALQLPLKIVERDGASCWEYSPDTMIEITSSHQMRLVAAGLRDTVFTSSEKLSFPRIRTILGVQDADIERCFETLFKRTDGDYSPITADEFFVCVQTLYTDRADLHHKVESFLNAADIAETAMNAIFLVACLLLLFWAFGFPMNTLMLTLPAILPTIAFAISQSVTDLVESVVFVTVRRPYGIGDVVQIDGDCYVVVRISLMTTDFVGLDHKLVMISNSALSKMPIFNHRRAGPAVIVFKANIAYTTEPDKLQQLRELMLDYVRQHSDSWKPEVVMLMDGLDDGASLVITFKFFHRLTWHESILPQAKTDIIQQLRLTMRTLNISDSEPTAWVNVDATGRVL